MPELPPGQDDVVEVVVKGEYVGQPVLQVHHLRINSTEGAGATILEILSTIFDDMLDLLRAVTINTYNILELTGQIVVPEGSPPGFPPPRGLIWTLPVNLPGLLTGDGLPGQAAVYFSEKASNGPGAVVRGGQFIGGIAESQQDDGAIIPAAQPDFNTYRDFFLASHVSGTPGVDSADWNMCIWSETLFDTGVAPALYAPAIEFMSLDVLVTTMDRRKRGTATGGFNP